MPAAHGCHTLRDFFFLFAPEELGVSCYNIPFLKNGKQTGAAERLKKYSDNLVVWREKPVKKMLCMV